MNDINNIKVVLLSNNQMQKSNQWDFENNNKIFIEEAKKCKHYFCYHDEYSLNDYKTQCLICDVDMSNMNLSNILMIDINEILDKEEYKYYIDNFLMYYVKKCIKETLYNLVLKNEEIRLLEIKNKIINEIKNIINEDMNQKRR